MNYLKQYISLIRKAKNRSAEIAECELHHIFPKSIYGENNTLVKLSFREHYIAHKLLWKICKKRYGWKHQKTRKMAMAFHIMIYGKGDTKRPYKHNNSYLYESARIAAHEAKRGKIRIDMKGKSYFGASEEIIRNGIEKMRIKKTGMKNDYPKNRNSPPCSAQKAKKISETRKRTKEKFIMMTQEEFDFWLSNQNYYTKNGRINSNVSRAMKWRKESCLTN